MGRDAICFIFYFRFFFRCFCTNRPFSSLGYAYEKTITIDHTKVSGSSDLT